MRTRLLLLLAALGVLFGATQAAADSTASPSRPTTRSAGCPDPGMVLVEGDYCPDVRHTCKRYLPAVPPYQFDRCAEYGPATCATGARVHMRYCIDREEFAAPGERLPMARASWTDAKRVCEGMSKRVCLESEWNFACEGEEMRPYPYGWKRDADACNADNIDIFTPAKRLKDLRVGANDKPRCVSTFGVHNLTGNLEEWTTMDESANAKTPHPAMKGAWWQPGRNHCRARQTAHDHVYAGIETGFRCCAGTSNPIATTR